MEIDSSLKEFGEGDRVRLGETFQVLKGRVLRFERINGEETVIEVEDGPSFFLAVGAAFAETAMKQESVETLEDVCGYLKNKASIACFDLK